MHLLSLLHGLLVLLADVPHVSRILPVLLARIIRDKLPKLVDHLQSLTFLYN